MTDESLTDEKRPLIEHFVELKRRLLIVALAFVAAVGVCYVYAPEIYRFLVEPLVQSFPDPASRRMIYTSLIEAFFTYLKLAMFGGIFIAFPVIAAQIYLFLAPGLYKREKRLFLPYLIAAPVFFLIGAAFCYYVIFPNAWVFFLSFETAGGTVDGLPIQLEAKVSEYLSLVMHLIIAFGLAFQLPVLLVLMAQFGWVKAKTLARGRKYALVGIVAVSAIITPPDIFSQVALSIPVYGLYELSIFLCRIIERRNVAENGESCI